MIYNQIQMNAPLTGDVVMTDHPGWLEEEPSRFVRAVSTLQGDGGCLVATDESTWIEPFVDADFVSAAYGPDHITIASDASNEFSARVSGYRVARWRNPSLWDAIALSIVRQVIRASHARKLYRLGASTWGEEVSPGRFTFPGPDKVLELSDDDFRAQGLAFQMPKLRRAATAYLQHHEAWEQLSAADLYDAMISVPGIGPWSASVAVVDYTNDFSFYPFDDLAVRACARKIWPELNFSKSQAAFRDEWLAACNDQIATLTAMTLAIGAHLEQQPEVANRGSGLF